MTSCWLSYQMYRAIRLIRPFFASQNRELQIMRQLDHCNIVQLKYFFFSQSDKDEVYLNLLLEFIPETVYRVARHYNKQKQQIPLIYVKVNLLNQNFELEI